MRLFLPAILMFVVLVSFGQQRKSDFTDEFQIGIFWPPVWEHTNQKQYKRIKEANIGYIQNVLGSLLDTEERNLKMLSLCEKYGLKLFVADPRVNGTKADIGEMIQVYGEHPATAGYYVIDEPHFDGIEAAAKKYQIILEFDRQVVPYVNLLPQWSLPDYSLYVTQWIETCGREKLKYLSFDCYPFMADGSFRESYYENLDFIRRAGLEKGVKTSCYLQSVGIPGVYRRPGVADLRLNVFSCLAYGIKNLVWFTYWTPTKRGEVFTNAIIDSCGQKTDLYLPFKQLNQQMKQLGKTLIGLDAVNVFHTGITIPEDGERLPSDFVIKPEDTEKELIISWFEQEETHRPYVMIVNKSLETTEIVRMIIGPGVNGLKEISSVSGKTENIRFNTNSRTMELKLLPGEGKLYSLVE
ncbi:hypothetical protein [Gaoshiqia sp. Z1-71]|uniref:hypothetical protein n=1 Tax=Gaoshiqia hydrogeniformans TaxID=3290090 RepID=UPI003BF9128C